MNKYVALSTNMLKKFQKALKELFGSITLIIAGIKKISIISPIQKIGIYFKTTLSTPHIIKRLVLITLILLTLPIIFCSPQNKKESEKKASTVPAANTFTHNNSSRFAKNYTTNDLLNSPVKQKEFIAEFLKSEGKFHQPGVGYNDKSGLTYDGYAIDPQTGGLKGAARNWSASSKESLHISILSLAVSKDERASLFISPNDPSSAPKKALTLLEKKIKSYEKFNKEYPGYGGFLPWFLVSDKGMRPTNDWKDRVPGLDNGQFAWSLFLTDHILRTNGHHKLANRYRAYWQRLAKNAVTIFYDTATKKIRAEAKIKNTGTKNISSKNYSNNAPGYMLDDPYEGELMALFISLFGEWKDASQITHIWKNKKLKKAVYTTKAGKKITVRQGHWYSAHEMWNFLVLPYVDSPLICEVIRLGEVARTIHSRENNIPGLFASVNAPDSPNTIRMLRKLGRKYNYISSAGIQALASQKVNFANVVAPYAAFPVILQNTKQGLAWLQVMLAGPRMQGPYGSTEAITTDGKYIATLLTWDAKATNVLALMKKASLRAMRSALKTQKVYTKFLSYVEKKYKRTFGDRRRLKGKNLKIVPPNVKIPQSRVVSDFVKIEPSAKGIDILKGTNFNGGGELYQRYKKGKAGKTLYLPKALGYIWTGITPVDIKKNPVINFRVKTKGGNLNIEVKNSADRLIHSGKIGITFPNTKGKWQTYSLDISSLITNSNTQAAIFVFSDPNTNIKIKSTTFSIESIKNSSLLSYDSHRFKRQKKPTSSVGSAIAGLANFFLFIGSATIYALLFKVSLPIPIVIAATVIASLLLTKKDLPLWLEAILKTSVLIYPFLGGIMLAYQAYKVRQAKQRARKIRGSLKDTKRQELSAFKAALEKKYQISLKDDARNSREIVYVNTQNS
ncbi:hypothetical protein ACFLQ1_02835, partial [Candidatus Auribacterota bacterium]